ncbi:MAG TPA: neutral/alkaline non-lysosomal ceramidase N-terminal domain-containing protein [Bryobacteraceae bacterium]|nr:neutral/alkaline non-lysosomal ceramidase N-terminal domain-containing protein [Bryobacteraceae bacterium]
MRFALLVWTLPLMGQFRAGVAKADLDPPVGTPMAGYATRYSKGTLDPIEARVLAMSDGARKVAFVTLDLCYTFEPAVMEEIRAGVRGAVDEVIFHASHTHSGPTYAASPEATRHAIPRVIQAIETAARALQAARIGNGWGNVYLGFNRRYLRPDGSLEMFWRNETKISTTFPVDPTVGVIRIDGASGTPIAILVEYSCHPVVLGPENLLYSADYPGEMRRFVEKHLGGMAFFLEGAPGDINPYFDKTALGQDAVALMKETGDKLGAEAVRVAKKIQTVTPASPRIQTKTVILESRNRWNLEKLKTEFVEKRHMEPLRAARATADPMQLPVTTLLIRTGDADADLAFVGLPGEPFNEFETQLRSRSPLPNSFLIGYTNGYFWYFPTIAAAVRGGYGADSVENPTEVGMGERMVNAGLISIYDLLGKLSAEPRVP